MTWSEKHLCCLNCATTTRKHRSGGLCANCYDFVAKRADPDTQYRMWLLGTGGRNNALDFPTSGAWFEACEARIGAKKTAEMTGLSFGNYAKAKAKTTLRVSTADRLAVTAGAGAMVEFCEAYPPVGKKGWSEQAEHCQLCGTFFHPHHQDGYCKECWSIQAGKSKRRPRDVRLSGVEVVA